MGKMGKVQSQVPGVRLGFALGVAGTVLGAAALMCAVALPIALFAAMGDRVHDVEDEVGLMKRDLPYTG